MTVDCPPIASGSAWRDTAAPLEFEGRVYSGAQLDGLVNRRARLFVESGITRREKLLVVMENTPDVVITLLASWRIGATVVPVPPRNGPRAGAWGELHRRAELTGARRIVATTESDGLGELAQIETTGDLQCSPAVVESQTSYGDLAVIQFSSGSTGQPKPIAITHRAMHANARAVAGRLGLDATTVGYCWLPLHHDMGLMGGLVTTLHTGGRFVLSSPRSFALDPVGWLVACADLGATFTGGPPFAYQLVLDRLARSADRLEGRSLESMRAAIIGSERVAPTLYREFEASLARYGWRPGALSSAYGLAENTVAAAMSVPLAIPSAARSTVDGSQVVLVDADDEGATVMSCGTSVDGTTVTIRDATGERCGAGTVGDIWIEGDSIALADPDAEHETGPSQPTGDVGALLDGELFVVGRTRELVKSAGRTFAPQDLEDVIRRALPEPFAVGVGAEHSPEHATDLLYVVIEDRGSRTTDLRGTSRAVNGALIGQFGIRAHAVSIARPGAVPRTSSGKLRRGAIPAIVRGLIDG